jgi:hypothetical protein
MINSAKCASRLSFFDTGSEKTENEVALLLGRSGSALGARRWTTDALFGRSGLRSNVIGKCSRGRNGRSLMAEGFVVEAFMLEILMNGNLHGGSRHGGA